MRTFIMFLLMIVSLPLYSSYYNGGELTWECTPNGNFKFQLVWYRECGAVSTPNSLFISTNVPGFSTIGLNKVSLTDISPVCGCAGGTHITCATATTFGTGATEKVIFTSDVSYPGGVALTGTPPVTGWTFWYSSCCRNPATNIIGQDGYLIRAVMYPYNNTPVNTCFDNSPVFEETPSTIVCSGYPNMLNYSAKDFELDSLNYKYAQPMKGMNQPIVNYYAGYGFNSPLPGPSINPNNIAPSFDSESGKIFFTSYTTGIFTITAKVTAYKCGQKVAEIYRDIQMVISNCSGTNNPPSFNQPIMNNYLYFDTVIVGELLSIPVTATDFEYCPLNAPQNISLIAFGSQFGTPINPAGCINPPCATLTPSPTPTTPITGQFGVQTTFNWQTTCDHLNTNIGCGNTSNEYNFLFKVKDDYCPVPKSDFMVVHVTVINKPAVPSPSAITGYYDTAGNSAVLNWTTVIQDSLHRLFQSYQIWVASDPSGPFQLVDSLMNITDSIFIDTNVGTDDTLYYFVVTKSWLCEYGHGAPQDTATIILPNTSGIDDVETIKRPFNIHPNPTNGKVIISFDKNCKFKSVMVFTQTGQMIKQYKLSGIKDEINLLVDLNGFSPGTYFLKIHYGDQKHETKALILR